MCCPCRSPGRVQPFGGSQGHAGDEAVDPAMGQGRGSAGPRRPAPRDCGGDARGGAAVCERLKITGKPACAGGENRAYLGRRNGPKASVGVMTDERKERA